MYRTIFIQRCCMNNEIVSFITSGKGVIFMVLVAFKVRIVDDYVL